MRNKMNLGSHWIWIMLYALVFLITGCEHRPLVDSSSITKIHVNVNAKSVSNVTCDIYNEKIPVPEILPDAMRVLFYNQEAGTLVSESFITDKTQTTDDECVMYGMVNVLPGTYKMLVYSFGDVDTYVQNYKIWSQVEAKAQEANEYVQREYTTRVQANGRIAEKVTNMPNHIAVARNESETIPYHNGEHVIVADASTVVDSYYLQVKVEGLEYVTGAEAYLSGMASGNLLATDTKVESPEAIIHIPLLKSDDQGVPVLCNVFNTFGRNRDAVNELLVTFDLTTLEGNVVSHTFDITELFHSEACIKHHWLLLEETIKVDADAGGFKPGVGEWEEENHKIFF